MISKLAVPPAHGEPTQTHSVAADFRNRPEFHLAAPVKGKRSAFLLLVPLLVLILASAAGFGGYRYYLAHQPKATTASTAKQAQVTDPYAGWMTYTSAKEQATFRYPRNWTVAKYSISSNDASNTDHIGLVSPSGAITISYVTDLTGFGNEHSASYPLNTVVDKTPIPSAPGLYVVSGTTTLDGTTYYPWIAVQDSDGIVASGVTGNVVTFTGRRALNPTTNDVTGILFSTSGGRTSQNSPALTKAQAISWFSSSEAKQARLILLSLNDAANQYLTIKEWNVKLPLTPAIQDAYYSVMGSGRGADGLPNTAWLGMRSLDSNGCDVAFTGPSTTENPIGAILRVSPTDRDPVSNMLYTQQDPGGVTLAGFYYAFAPSKDSTCAPAATLQSVDAAFGTATKGIVTADTVMKIPELGIQITVPADLRDLTYHVSTVMLRDGHQATLAMFSTSQLTAMDPACGATFGPLGSLERVDEQYPSNDPNSALNYGLLVKQFPTFYISGGAPNAGCSTDLTALGMSGWQRGEFGKAKSTVQPLS